MAMLLPFLVELNYLPVENPWVWACAVPLAVYAITQLYLLNVLMSRGRVMLAVPIFSSLNLMLTMVTSAVLFGDFDETDTGRTWGFLMGAAIVMLGIFLLPLIQGTTAEADSGGGGVRIAPDVTPQKSLGEGTSPFTRKFYVVQPRPDRRRLATISPGGHSTSSIECSSEFTSPVVPAEIVAQSRPEC